MLIALRKKIRAKLSATMQEIPFSLITAGACSREEPQPKFLPATIISPAFTFGAKVVSMSSIACSANSAISAIAK